MDTFNEDGYKALLPPWAPGYHMKTFEVGFFNFVFYYWHSLFKQLWKDAYGATGYFSGIFLGMAAGCANRVGGNAVINYFQSAQMYYPSCCVVYYLACRKCCHSQATSAS